MGCRAIMARTIRDCAPVMRRALRRWSSSMLLLQTTGEDMANSRKRPSQAQVGGCARSWGRCEKSMRTLTAMRVQKRTHKRRGMLSQLATKPDMFIIIPVTAPTGLCRKSWFHFMTTGTCHLSPRWLPSPA